VKISPLNIPILKKAMKANPVVGIATIAKIANRATGAYRANCATGAKIVKIKKPIKNKKHGIRT
jgi:hypothetical protein